MEKNLPKIQNILVPGRDSRGVWSYIILLRASSTGPLWHRTFFLPSFCKYAGNISVTVRVMYILA